MPDSDGAAPCRRVRELIRHQCLFTTQTLGFLVFAPSHNVLLGGRHCCRYTSNDVNDKPGCSQHASATASPQSVLRPIRSRTSSFGSTNTPLVRYW